MFSFLILCSRWRGEKQRKFQK